MHRCTQAYSHSRECRLIDQIEPFAPSNSHLQIGTSLRDLIVIVNRLNITHSDLHQSTLQASYLKKQLYLDQDLVRLNIWDTVEYSIQANQRRTAHKRQRWLPFILLLIDLS